MDENTIGRNITFPIYNDDGTSFHNLSLKKATVDSVVMSLGDKVTGDVMYIDNTLSFTMKEYIVVDNVKYFLVNPPTIVREGMVADNSQLKGMTKYSFTFYHPMYMLGNFPFTDVAVTNDEALYLSQNKTFYWIGTLFEFIAKLNANLANSEWVVISNITQNSDMWEKASKQSDVLSFDKQFISDALKTAYDTWDIPFVVSPTNQTINGVQKKFKIEFGLPIEDIYTTSDQNERVPFVFQFGKGVGLKNNSRTPRNNKIVTRIIGEGSERNIPYGYPQIQWFGAQSAEFTYGDHAGVYTNVSVTIDGVTHTIPKLISYPIYKGILGGEWVSLIKHPFTRTKLMPKEYRESVLNKVSVYDGNGDFNTHYNPDAEIIDYIDAIGSTYAHEINPLSPSAEMHTFEDIYPQLLLNDDYGFISVTPINKNLQPVADWDDTIDDEGNYVQSHFKVKLPQLQFDVYACAAITESMQINMKSGSCLGCTFDVEVDWEDYKKNFYHSDGTFDPAIHTTVGDGHVRDGAKYPDSSQGQIDLILKKDINTFGTVMPNVYQQPKGETSTGANDGDRFVFLGISLPNSYIISAETKLSYQMELYMKDNNNYYYDYPLKFDEHFLATHTDILSQIANNKKIRFVYGNQEIELYVKQITIKYGESVLPKYDIVLTDNIEVVLNQIGQAVGEMRHISDTFIVMNNDLRYEFNKANEKLERTIQKNGKINRFYYYAGEWEDTALKGNRVTDLEAPFFSYTTLDANNNPVVSYWVFNPQENGLYTWSEMGQPAESTTSNPTAWVRMISDFKYIITQAIFGEYAQFGSAIINGDWLLSTHGKRNGGDSQQYIYFDPQDPMGLTSGHFAPNFCVDLKLGDAYFNHASLRGGSRSPFTYAEYSNIWDDSTQEFSDNIALKSSDNVTIYDLLWDVSQSGRRITLTNYYWNGQYSVSASGAQITAPNGCYFFEDGIRKTKISLSREAVELLGYGDNTTFYGWIVLNRIDLGTTKRYGHQMKMLAWGRVTYVNDNRLNVNYHAFDGTETTMSATRSSKGVYVLSWDNNDWFAEAGHVFAMVCGYGEAVEKPNPIFASVLTQTTNSVTVQIADDSSRNDGAFNFFLMNFNDWLYLDS